MWVVDPALTLTHSLPPCLAPPLPPPALSDLAGQESRHAAHRMMDVCTLVTVVVYLLFGGLGYLAFGAATEQSILDNLPTDSPFRIAVAKASQVPLGCFASTLPALRPSQPSPSPTPTPFCSRPPASDPALDCTFPLFLCQ